MQRSSWPMARHDPQGTGRTDAVGPRVRPQIRWKCLAGSFLFFQPTVGPDGTVYVGADDLCIYAVRPDGSTRWSCQVPEYAAVHHLVLGPNGSICSSGGAPTDMEDSIIALATDGAVRWTFYIGHKELPRGPAIGQDGTIYYGSYENGLYAIHPDGSVRWNVRREHLETDAEPEVEWFDSISTPVVGADGTIYCNGSSALVAFHPDGTLLWMRPLGGRDSIHPLVAHKGTILAGTYSQLMAYAPDGAIRWTAVVDRNYDTPQPTIGPDGDLYVPCQHGMLRIFHLDGTERGAVAVGAPIVASPVVGLDSALYVMADRLRVFNRDGLPRWSFAFSVPFVSGPVLGPDGTVYVGSDLLYAIGSDGQSRWTFRTHGGLPVINTPVVDAAGSVITMLDRRTVITLDPEGEKLWAVPAFRSPDTTPIVITGGRQGDMWVLVDALLALGDRVYFPSDGVYAVNSAGKVAWSFAAEGISFLVPLPPPYPPLCLGHWVVGEGDTWALHLVGLEAEGTVRWSHDLTGIPRSGLVGQPAVSRDGTIIIACREMMIAIEPAGSRQWTYQMPGESASNPLVSATGTIYCVRRDREGYLLVAVGIDGVLHWSQRLTQQHSFSRASLALGADGTIYLIISHDQLYAIAPDGSVRWTYPAAQTSKIFYDSDLLVDGNGTIYASTGTALHAVAPDGRQLWQFEFAEAIRSGPILGPDGTLYIGCQNGYLYALSS